MINQNIGIYRKIPLKNRVVRTDGTISNNIAKITDISVSENYTITRENGYKIIKIGNEDNTYIGKHSYTIKYTYNIGKDKLKNADELYYNLIGNDWDTSISNVTFKITMPKLFDESLLGFSSGKTGSTDNSNVFYNVNQNVISGYLTNTLNSGEALTVRLTLPEDYFVGESLNIDEYVIIVIVISLVCVFIAYILWIKYGKNDEIIETVEFYPPEGYNSAEVGFLYNGFANTSGIVSLLIYLANAGYLKIEESEKKDSSGKAKSFKIIKVKEYDGKNKYEKMFFDGLFQGEEIVDVEKFEKLEKEAKDKGEKFDFDKAAKLSTKISKRTQVTESDLYNNFYMTIDKIKDNLNNKKNRSKIFDLSAMKKKKWILLMIILILVLITVRPIVDYPYYGIQEIGMTLLFSLIGVLISFVAISDIKFISVKKQGVIFGILFGGIPWICFMYSTLVNNLMYIVMCIIGLICILSLMAFAQIMSKRTPYGIEILGKLKGFKRFLETAEKPQLESLVARNPEYFYNILPYTYALGVSDVWIKQFERILFKAPEWYNSRDDFNIDNFGKSFTRTMSSVSSAMICNSSNYSSSREVNSHRSRSSAGGSSGRGSGGGGGGSW